MRHAALRVRASAGCDGERHAACAAIAATAVEGRRCLLCACWQRMRPLQALQALRRPGAAHAHVQRPERERSATAAGLPRWPRRTWRRVVLGQARRLDLLQPREGLYQPRHGSWDTFARFFRPPASFLACSAPPDHKTAAVRCDRARLRLRAGHWTRGQALVWLFKRQGGAWSRCMKQGCDCGNTWHQGAAQTARRAGTAGSGKRPGARCAASLRALCTPAT